MWLGTTGGVVHVHNNIIERSLQGIRGNLLALEQPAKQDMWAVGLAFCGTQPPTSPICEQRVAIYHFDGITWTPFATDAQGILEAVAAVSADDVWAAGSTMNKTQSASLILHFQHGVWRQYATTFPVDLFSLSMAGTTDGWAVGYTRVAGGTGNAPGLLYYRDGIWIQASLD